MIGLSSLYLLLKGKEFRNLIEEIILNKDIQLWEIVDEGDFTLDKEKLKLLKRFFEEGLRFSIHSPFSNLNIASLDNYLRTQSIRRIKQTIDFASELEVLNVVIHPGSKPMDPSKVSKAKELNEEALLTFYDYGNSYGIKVSVENMLPGKFFDKTLELKEFYDNTKVNLPITFDVSHAYLGGYLKEILKEFLTKFYAVHISDTRGSYDEHLCLGEGNINWLEVIGKLKEIKLLYVVESVEEPLTSFKRLKTFLHKEPLKS
ncbi:endonuclease 4 [archaeon HR06]|nr:endonuclease 4 [archaeon HR06]